MRNTTDVFALATGIDFIRCNRRIVEADGILRMVSVSVVTAWKDRQELSTTLAENAPMLDRFGAQVILVNCGGNLDALRDIVGRSRLPVILVNVHEAKFNKALALNVGIHYATSEYIFIIDSDVIIPEETFATCLSTACPNSLITIRRLRETAGLSNVRWKSGGSLSDIVFRQLTSFMWSDGTETTVENYRHYSTDSSRGGQGQLLTSRQNLVNVNGYSSELEGWGFEDIDILIRLQHLLGLKYLQIGEATHISHGDEERCIASATKSINNRENAARAYRSYAEGLFHGTLTADVKSSRHSVLRIRKE